ncbi:MAG: cell division ATPase MinD [Candidatus Woesearchaeota archaeon]
MTKFLSITSAKGGVGKTTVSINLGLAISSFGAEVIVVDGNLSTPNLGLYLGMQKPPLTMHDVVKGKKHISETVYSHSSGLKIVPASIAIEETKNVNFDNLSKVIFDLYGMAQLVLIDSSAGIGHEAQSALKSSEETLIVVTPDLAAVADGLKTLSIAKALGVKVKGVIVNKFKDDSELSIEAISSLFNLPAFAIPYSNEMISAVLKKQPIVFLNPECDVSIAYKQLAAQLLGQEYEYKIKKDTVFSRLFKKGFSKRVNKIN